MKKLWSFEDKCAKLSENFAAETPLGRVFRSCGTNFWHTSAICSTIPLILKLRYTCEITFELWNGCEMISKLWNGCEMISKLQNGCENASSFKKWSVNMPLFCEMISKLWNGCKITSKHRNGLQIAKLTCKMEEGLQKRFAKPREVAKMLTEPCNHASEEESPAHPGITHTKPLTPLLTS